MSNHGSHQITIIGNILMAKFYGAWNKEQAACYCEEAKAAVEELIHKPWGRVIDHTHFEGAGPEIVPAFIELQEWAKRHNGHFIVFVNSSVLPRYLMEKYGDSYGDYEHYSSIEEAMERVTYLLDNYDN